MGQFHYLLNFNVGENKLQARFHTVNLIQCKAIQNPLEKCFGYCLPRKMVQRPWCFCRDNPNTNKPAICGQFSEISRQGRS